MRSRNTRLFMPALFTLLFGALLCAGPAANAAAPPAPLQVDARAPLAAMVSLTDGKLRGLADSLDLLSRTSEVQSGNWARMKPLLARLQEQSLPGNIFFARPDGYYYIVSKGLERIKVSDRAYFKKAMAGQVSIGELIIGRTSGEQGVAVAVPVKRGKAVIGVLAGVFYLKQFSQWLQKALRLPADMLFWVITPTNRIALDWQSDLIYRDVRSLGSPSLNQAVAAIRTHREGSAVYVLNGKQRRVVYQTSPLTGWHFVLGVVVP